MDEIKNDAVVEEVEEETPETELSTETDWEAEAKKARGIAQRLRTKLTKAEEKKKEVAPAVKTPTTDGLDETQLDFLDVKGITDEEDIAIIERHVKRTGETVRQALKDDYVASKLAGNKSKRDVEKATPGATKRSGAQGNDLATAIAKYEQTGELPADYALRSQVVNKMEERASVHVPSWHR